MFRHLGKLNSKEKDYNDLRAKLDEWYDSYTGQLFLNQAKPYVDGVLSNLFGYHLLQIGHLKGSNLLCNSRISHRTVIESHRVAINDGCNARLLLSELDTLPIASDSVDVVILPHSLEIHPHPHRILREIDRILVPEGHVVIIGFNPSSLWGLVRLVKRWFGRLPWHGRFLSLLRLKDWLQLLGFELVHNELYFYRPPPGLSPGDEKARRDREIRAALLACVRWRLCIGGQETGLYHDADPPTLAFTETI